jgi:hypothetical protein
VAGCDDEASMLVPGPFEHGGRNLNPLQALLVGALADQLNVPVGKGDADLANALIHLAENEPLADIPRFGFVQGSADHKQNCLSTITGNLSPWLHA